MNITCQTEVTAVQESALTDTLEILLEDLTKRGGWSASGGSVMAILSSRR
jgi:hypothetical protein